MPVYEYFVIVKYGKKTRKEKRYRYEFRKTVDGIHYQKRKQGFYSRDEALQAEFIDKEELTTPSNQKQKKVIILDDLFSHFLEYKETKQKIATIENYRHIYYSQISSFSKQPISTITPQQIIKWKAKLIKEKTSENHVNKTIGLFRSILEYGVKNDYLVDGKVIDALDNVSLNQLKNEKISWSNDELCRFFNTFERYDIYYYYFKLLFDSTMRPNEFRCLQVKDIQDNYLIVKKSCTTKIKGKGLILQTPKTKASIRNVIMPDDDIEFLKEHTKDYDPDDFIFGKNQVLSETTLRRELNKHIELANIPHGSLYTFRHTSVTLLLKSGVPLLVVSKRAGHSNVSTTMNFYWHLFNGDDKKAIDGLKSLKIG